MPIKKAKASFALTSATTMACALLLSGPAHAQTADQPPLAPQEEVLEDGQIVTRIFPGQRPDTVAPEGEALNDPDAMRAIDPNIPSVLAIVSHPDDEIILAPALARIAREKGEVVLVFATSGDAGSGNSGLEHGSALGELRENEARCAAFALGLEEPIFWKFGDGTLAGSARNTSEQMQDMSERIAGLISLHQPSVVMTWGPDGGYGHADHRMTSNAVAQVVQAMGPDRPDLLYAAFPAPTREEEELEGFDGWARIHPSLVTDRIAYEVPDLDATIAAVNCYQSQFGPTARRVLAGTLDQRVWRGNVPFRLAFPRAR